MSTERRARCRAQITDRASATPRRCRNAAPNPNGYCFRHQLEARIEAAR